MPADARPSERPPRLTRQHAAHLRLLDALDNGLHDPDPVAADPRDIGRALPDVPEPAPPAPYVPAGERWRRQRTDPKPA